MAKDERKIHGSVAVSGYTRAFLAGDEDALADAIKDDTDKMIDVEHLTKSGAISGYGVASPASAEAKPEPVKPEPPKKLDTKVTKPAKGEKATQRKK